MADVDKTYHSLLEKIMAEGFKYEDPNRKGVFRKQIPSYTFEHDFKNGFPAITTKKLYWKGVVGELLWFLKGDTNIKFLVDNNINIWNKDVYYSMTSNGYKGSYKDWEALCKKYSYVGVGEAGRIYGAQWRWFNGEVDGESYQVDQIETLIRDLKTTPMGTKHLVTAWNPAELDVMALPPCHWSFEVLVEPLSYQDKWNNVLLNGYFGKEISSEKVLTKLCLEKDLPIYKFTLKWHQRSVDTFLGLPFNIASYALLAQIIGKMTNMIPKGIIGDLSNVHIYLPHLDAVRKQLTKDISKYDSPNFQWLVEPNTKANVTKDIIDLMKIEHFQLSDYSSYPAIKAEMLAYNK